MATVGVTGVFRKELVGVVGAGLGTPYLMIPAGLTRVTLTYKAAAAGTANAVQKTYDSGEAVRAGTATWIDVVPNVVNTAFTNADKTLLGDETVTAVRVSRGDQNITLVVTGILLKE